jgi:hypothetical protein
MVKKKAKKPVTKKITSTYRTPNTSEDFKTAALVVSLTINVAIFIGWLAIKVTNKYDEQVVNFLFHR